MIVIVNYGLGNLSSIKNMLDYLNVNSKISNDFKDINNAKFLILPGVGNFDIAMKKIYEMNLKSVLEKKVLDEKIPILGICLGMQLFFLNSEEGEMKGLNWIKGDVKKIKPNGKLKVPHMGWNDVYAYKKNKFSSLLIKDSRFYFVHSYFVKTRNRKHSLMYTNYGFDFDVVINDKNIYGCQFHPEKSHKFGLNFLQTFLKINA